MTEHPEPGGKLLRRDYWLVLSTPLAPTTAADFERHLADHLTWLLRLEDEGTVLMSGPLTSGPGTRPGSGVTVLRAESADHARQIADADPFVVAGLRTPEVFRWQVNEGAINIRVSLGTGTYAWD
ncbi:YciI family protein [Streptomyces sp. NPDC057199]|uniref:YciI family protein n=1 Tax=Streptomyces sp. NPDC057199 TaxID=3346047 RepID=UPI00363E1630